MFKLFHPRYTIFLFTLTGVALVLTQHSCSRWGTTLELREVSQHPRIEEMLSDLNKNDKAIQTIKGRGTFTLKTPQLDTIYQLPQSDIVFHAPDYLYVVGRKYTATVLRLTCYRDETLMELPTEKEFYYQQGGEYFIHSNAEVTPLDIFYEIFLPEQWDKIDVRHIKLESYDNTAQQATLTIYKDKNLHQLHRRIVLQGIPWVLLKSERFLDNELVAVTERKNYRITEDGFYLPEIIHCTFPKEQAFMTIKLNKCQVNVPVELPPNQLIARVKRLIQSGYDQITMEN